MDISIAGIEEQWKVAELNAGRPMETAALMRAQILATLVAAGYRELTYDTVPEPALVAPEDISFTDLVDAEEPDDDEDDIWADVERERKR